MKTALEKGKILIVDDEERIRNILAMILKDQGYEVETAQDGIEAITRAESFKPYILIVDLQMPRLDGVETILRIRERFPRVVGIILTAHGTIPSAVQAIKQGIYDYIQKPFDNEEILLVIRRALEVYRLKEEVDELKNKLQQRYGIDSILGEATVIKQLRSEIQKIAHNDVTVLIEGESGTGKELAARAIHYQSNRRNNSLIIIDCAAIPINLIESEFFGHEKGAFTDARERRIGKFEEADTGTIFLDEIGELPLEAQTKLLRVLQEKKFTRIGGSEPVSVNVRVIAATNKNLDQQVREGKFREDLYYRLNVLKLHIPPLREHKEDILLYVHHFLSKYRDTFKKNITRISDDALELLKNYDWKGNIRELESVIQRAMLNAAGSHLSISDLTFLERSEVRKSLCYNPEFGLEAYVKSLSEQSEREIILETLEETNWNRTEAAEKLKISRKTLFNKMRYYGLDSEENKGGKSRH